MLCSCLLAVFLSFSFLCVRIFFIYILGLGEGLRKLNGFKYC